MADGAPLSPQRLYGERLLQCVQAVVSVSREDCRGAGVPLVEVLVTVLALWGPAGLGAKVRGPSCFASAPGREAAICQSLPSNSKPRACPAHWLPEMEESGTRAVSRSQGGLRGTCPAHWLPEMEESGTRGVRHSRGGLRGTRDFKFPPTANWLQDLRVRPAA